MVKTKIFIWTLFFIFSNAQLITYSKENRTKYNNVIIPWYIFEDFGLSGEYIQVSPSKSPKIGIFTFQIFADYCNTLLPTLQELPEWKNGTYCQKNFCEEENVLYNQAKAFLIGNNLTSFFNYRYIYYSSFYICSKCMSGINQTYLNGTFENCKWNQPILITNTTRNYTNNRNCPSQELILSNVEYCYYPSLDQYYVSYTHTTYIVLYVYLRNVQPLIIMSVCTLLLITTIFINLLPCFVEMYLKVQAPLLNWKNKIFIFISFQNINLLLLLTLEIVVFLLSFLDKTLESSDNGGLSIIIGFFFMTLIYLFLNVLYSHISHSSVKNLDCLGTREIIFLLIFLPLILITAIMLIVLNLTIGRNPVLNYIYTAIIIIGLIITSILGIVLLISSLIIFFKLSFSETNKSTLFLKMKVRIKYF